MITISNKATISSLADIEESVKGTKLEIGAYSVVDSFVKIKPVGGMGDIIIGEHVVINSGCVFYSGNGISIGNHVAVAANCTFAPVNHAYKDRSKLIKEQRFLEGKGGIIIEDDVWIGVGSVILDGSVLRKGCVIGAMSLVRSEIPAYSIQGGNPLKLLGWRK